MCTEANDLLKFRMDYIYQIRITFLSNVEQRRVMLLTVTGTYPQVGTQLKKNITTNPC